MTSLPDPLVTADVDLRDFQFTPMFRTRLFGSSFHARVSDSGWRAGVTLWLRSWEQVPAGTLPDDEVELCRLAELGRDLKTWRRIEKEALWGWFKCSDQRLHHRTVAEGVNEAWERKIAQRDRTEAARVTKAARRLQQIRETQTTEPVTEPVTGLVAGPVTGPVTGSVTEAVTSSKGQGQGQPSLPSNPRSGIGAGGRAGLSDDFRRRLVEAVGLEPCRDDGDFSPIVGLLAEGCVEADVLGGITVALAKTPPKTRIRHWSAFVGWATRERDDRLAEPRSPGRSASEPAPRVGPAVVLKPGLPAVPVSAIRAAIGRGEWYPKTWGPKPGESGCAVPQWVFDPEPVGAVS